MRIQVAIQAFLNKEKALVSFKEFYEYFLSEGNKGFWQQEEVVFIILCSLWNHHRQADAGGPQAAKSRSIRGNNTNFFNSK